MSQLKFYKYSAMVLLVLNLGLIAFLLFSPPKGKGPHGNRKHLATEVMNLDETQTIAFEESANNHGDKMEEFSGEQRTLLNTYFQSLYDDNISATALNDSLLASICNIEQQKIELTYQHFTEIKTLLKPEQKEGFKKFTKDILKRILGGREKRPTPSTAKSE